MADETRELSPEETEEAFKTFGNFLLQVNATRAKVGTGVDGIVHLRSYIENLSTQQLNEIAAYFDYIADSYAEVMLMIAMVLLKREAEEKGYGR